MDNVRQLVQPPAHSLQGRDFLSLKHFAAEELLYILEVADQFKKRPPQPVLRGKTLGMIFAKSSTRTRVSFEVGIYQLGGCPVFLSQRDIQLGRGEAIADTARVLSRYLDGLMIRTFAHSDVEELARWSTIPVINGLTDLLHPCQAMADYLTIKERFGKLKGIKLAYIGDGNNMANSLILGAAKFGVHCTVACPAGYEPDARVISWAQRAAEATGASLKIVEDPFTAAAGAHVLYTDVWTSMGQEHEQQLREAAFSGYQINRQLIEAAGRNCIVLHCLPAHRGQEISAEALEGSHSAVFDQAENRLHVQKAIMALLMNGDR